MHSDSACRTVFSKFTTLSSASSALYGVIRLGVGNCSSLPLLVCPNLISAQKGMPLITNLGMLVCWILETVCFALYVERGTKAAAHTFIAMICGSHVPYILHQADTDLLERSIFYLLRCTFLHVAWSDMWIWHRFSWRIPRSSWREYLSRRSFWKHVLIFDS